MRQARGLGGVQEGRLQREQGWMMGRGGARWGGALDSGWDSVLILKADRMCAIR